MDSAKDTPNQVPFMVCNPTRLGAPGVVSEVRVCSMCVCTVWIAPSGVAFVKANPAAIIICLPCCVRRQKASGEQFDIEIPPGATDEIRAALRPKENN